MPKKTKKIPLVLSKEQIKSILQTFITKSKNRLKKFNAIRNTIMVLIMYFMGLRPKECFNALVDYVDLKKHEFYVPAENNKQRNQDLVPIPDFIVNPLNSYMTMRANIFRRCSILFPTLIRNKVHVMERGTFCRIFREALRKAGLYKVSYIDAVGKHRANYNLYSLRHSFGSRAYARLHDIRKTAVALRHYDFQCRSTLTYIHTSQNTSRKNIFLEIYKPYN